MNSEFIDRIVDVEKISSDITTTISNLNVLKGVINDINASIKTVSDGVRKSKNTDDLAKQSGKLNDEFTKGQKAAKDWQAEVSKLEAQTEKLTVSEKEASIAIAKARLELQAAQKATKEAAIAEIEATAKTKDLAGSYNALQKDLKNASKEYRALSEAERNSAKGKELLDKIQTTQASLKSMDASMGNYQRNVGNYASALDNIKPGLGGLATKLMEISDKAKKNAADWKEMDNSANLGIASMGKAPAGLAKIVAGFKGVGQVIGTVSKALIGNPIIAVITAIVGIFGAMKAAIQSNGQATEKLNQVFAPFKAMLGAVLQELAKVVTTFIDGALVVMKFGNAVMSLIPGLDKVAEKNRQAIELEREKQKLIREGILDKAFDAKEELRISDLRKKIMEKDNYSAEERLAFAREVDNAEKKMAYDDVDRANRNLKNFLKNMKLKGKTQKDYTLGELQQLTDLQAAKYSEEQKYFDKTRKLAGRTASLKDEIAAENEEADNKIIASRRRLVDSEFALMTDSMDKQLKLNHENYKRQIDDLRRNGELTKALKDNLLKAENQEAQKIRDEWYLKDLNEQIKNDELVISNMQRAGEDALALEKQLLNKKMEAEIKAGGDINEIRIKYQYLATDLETKNAEEKANIFAKTLDKELVLLKNGYAKKEKELKEQYLSGEIDRKEYEKRIKEIQLDAQYEANEKTIELLKKQLEISNLSADKRAEISKQIAELQIANENAVLDATIDANNSKVESDKQAAEKRKQIASDLIDATSELFNSIAELEKQQSENKISDIEKELEKSNEVFEQQQNNLDNAIMSDETRKQRQIELDEKKAAADKVIQDKINAEKVRQAKWEKAQGIISAIISTAKSIAASSELGFPLAIPFIALAAASGAFQVATIASQPLPAYEHGTDNHPGGLSLWGEKRPEVAVDPFGRVALATKPTVSNFEAGTKIYKSVSDYENFMAKQSLKEFAFDYDKMGDKINTGNVFLDHRGLWGVVNKQGSRTRIINKRYSR